MNKNLLEEIKRMNNLMGTKSILLETGKQTYQLIDNTIGWKKVGEFFDDLFDGVGRRSGNNGADEVADLMRRESDENFRKSYNELRLKAKADLQSYADTLSKKLQRGATNLTPDEKKLLVLLEKFAQTQQDAKTIKQEIPIIKQKVAKNLAGQERYTMVSDEVYGKVVNEVETKIANGEKVTENDLLNLYKAELDNLKKLDASGNPVGDLLPPELKQAMINRLKTEKKYKDFVNTLSTSVDDDVNKIDLRRTVNGQEEKLGKDIDGIYNDIVEKDFDTELVDANKELTRLKNELSKETDELKKIDLQREIDLKESQIKVLQKEKEFKTAVDDWVAGKSKTSTDVNRLAREVVNNREATEIMEDPLKRVFPDAAVGNQTTWSDYFIGFTDFIRGRRCSYAVCKVYQKWWELTGMNFFMNVIQNLAKTLDDILRKNEENWLGFGNYSRLRDPEFFKKQYQEIINEMQEIAARKEKGWENRLQLQRDRLMRLVETRRPQTDDPNWKRLFSSTADLQDQANSAIDNAWKEIKDSLRQADMKDLPGMKGLYEWLETKNIKGKDFFDTMEEFFTKFKDSITVAQTWFRELMPWMKKADGSYEKLMQKKVGVSDAEGDQISKEIADATREGVEKGGKAAKEGFTGAVSKVLSYIGKLFNEKLYQTTVNFCRYGLFTNLNIFKQILMRHGYIKGMLILYLKIVVGTGFVKAIGFLLSTASAFILDSLISAGLEPATAQTILLWITHPFESVRAFLGNKDSKLYLLLESDRMRTEKENFLETLFSKFANADNFKVYPFVEEFVNTFVAIFGTINDFRKGNTQVNDLNDDLSVIGGVGPNIIRFIFGTAVSYGIFVDNNNSKIYDWEEGLKKKLDEYMKDVDKLRKSSLKDVMGEDWDKLVLSARQKKLDSISPYIDEGCYSNDLVNLLKVKIDINPKFTKPLTELTLDKSKTVDNNQKLSLEQKISSLSSTTLKPEDEMFNANFSEIAGLVIGQDFYRIERGPKLSDGTVIPPGETLPNVKLTANSAINAKCCTFMSAYIKKEGDTTWYCIASPKVMEMIGGSTSAKEMVSIEEEVEAKKVFDKIIDGTSSLEKQKKSLEQKWEDVKFWVETYEKYLNYTKNKLYNKARFKNTLWAAKKEIGLTAKKAQEIKQITKEWQTYINNYLDKTKTVKTTAMNKERESFYSRLKSEFGLDVDANGHIDINKWFENYSDEKLEEYLNRGLNENKIKNKNIINERYLLGNRNMRSRYIFENEDEQRFGENKFDHWYDTFTFQKYDEKSGEFKDIETDSLKHGKIKERFNDFIKNYDGDDAFVRAVVDTHPEVLRFKYLKDQANIQEAYYPTGLASILSVIRESKGEYEIFSVSRQKGGNWNLVKGDFTQKEMSNMVLTKQIPPEKKPKERENGLESLKKKEATGTNSLRNDEKEGLKNLPKKVKEKVQEKISRGWTTELPPKIFKDFYEESEISSVFNEKIPIYKLEATPEFFRSLQKNSSHVLVRRGFCRSLLMAKNDSDINSEQRKVVNHILSKCEDKFEGKFGLRYLSKKS